MRRRIDRPEGSMVAGLIGVFLISAPVLGVAGYEGRLFFARGRLARWGEQCREQCGQP